MLVIKPVYSRALRFNIKTQSCVLNATLRAKITQQVVANNFEPLEAIKTLSQPKVLWLNKRINNKQSS